MLRGREDPSTLQAQRWGGWVDRWMGFGGSGQSMSSAALQHHCAAWASTLLRQELLPRAAAPATPPAPPPRARPPARTQPPPGGDRAGRAPAGEARWQHSQRSRSPAGEEANFAWRLAAASWARQARCVRLHPPIGSGSSPVHPCARSRALRGSAPTNCLAIQLATTRPGNHLTSKKKLLAGSTRR